MSDNETADETSTITRRRLLAASGTAAFGLATVPGSAAAHEVSTIAFCGCSQVTVYGRLLCDGDREPCEGGYRAVVYCNGTTVEKPLSGTNTRQNYDIDEDDSLPSDDCQIIAVEGTNYDGNDSVTFRICNTHCPANCANKGLAETNLSCDDPSSITSPTYGGITIQCNGCGRDEPGDPGNGNNGNNGNGENGNRNNRNGR